MTEIELNEAIERLSPTIEKDHGRRPWCYRRQMKDQRFQRLFKIVTGSYIPHAGYVDWSMVGNRWQPTGRYIKYPKNSNCQRWIKKETSSRTRHCKDIPFKGNYYRRLFDYWWTLY